MIVARPAAVGASAAAPACTTSWTNPAGGDWSTASDWSTGVVPTSTQAACVTIPVSAPVVVQGTYAVGSLTVGGSTATSSVELDGANLAIGSKSTIESTGVLSESGSTSTLTTVGDKTTLTNDGTVTIAGYLNVAGDLTNAKKGLIDVTVAGLTVDGPGELANSGEITVQSGGGLDASATGTAVATIDNAAGLIRNEGSVDVGSGGTFEEGAGVVTGVPPSLADATLDLVGTGTSTFRLGESETVVGTVAADQTLLLNAATVTSPGTWTNDGTVATTLPSTVEVPSGHALDNAGLIYAQALSIDGTLDNEASGSIATGQLTLGGTTTDTNDGSIAVGTGGSLGFASGATVTLDNEGRIADTGGVTVESPNTFEEGAGTTSGAPILIDGGGTLDLAGGGASSFQIVGGTLVGDIAAGQTVEAGATQTGSTLSVPASFTNYGTLYTAKVTINLPAGDTLTNDGLIVADAGTGFSVDGDLTNTSTGTINLSGNTGYGGELTMGTAGTTFDNAGTLDAAFPASVDLGNTTETFDNTGTFNAYAAAGNTPWGNTANDGGALAGTPEQTPSLRQTVILGGTINPVLSSGLPTPLPSPAQTLTFGLFGVETGGFPDNWVNISCPGAVTGGWSLSCNGITTANLIATSTTTLDPTTISLATSSPSSTYGQPVTFTATVTGESSAFATPTGTVIFYDDTNTNASDVNVLGTGTLSTSDGVTTATLTTSRLGPVTPGAATTQGSDVVTATYLGDVDSLASSSGSVSQTVDADSTGVSLQVAPSTSYAGEATTLTAVVTPSTAGPVSPTGVVEFQVFDGDAPVVVPVTTTDGVTEAVATTTTLPVGTDLVSAEYFGDSNYASSTSPQVTVTVDPVTTPSTEVTTTVLTAGTVGLRYSGQLDATGGIAPYKWKITGGSLPSWLKLGAKTGTLTGTPPASGTWDFTVTATDHEGHPGSQAESVTVAT